MWVATPDLPRTAAHPFYTRLNQILDTADFDRYVESICQRFYANEIGRPGLAPGRYFRLPLLIGYLVEPHEAVFTWILQRTSKQLACAATSRNRIAAGATGRTNPMRALRSIGIADGFARPGHQRAFHLVSRSHKRRLTCA